MWSTPHFQQGGRCRSHRLRTPCAHQLRVHGSAERSCRSCHQEDQPKTRCQAHNQPAPVVPYLGNQNTTLQHPRSTFVLGRRYFERLPSSMHEVLTGLLILWLVPMAACGQDAEEEPHPGRLVAVAAGAGVAITGSLVALDQAWFEQYEQVPFQTFNDGDEWYQMDKAGPRLERLHPGPLRQGTAGLVRHFGGVSRWVGGSIGWSTLRGGVDGRPLGRLGLQLVGHGRQRGRHGPVHRAGPGLGRAAHRAEVLRPPHALRRQRPDLLGRPCRSAC